MDSCRSSVGHRPTQQLPVIPQIAIDPRSVVDYIDKQLQDGELIRWRSCCPARRPATGRYGTRTLASPACQKVPLIARSRLKNDPTSLGVVTEPGRLSYSGLSGDDRKRAAVDEAKDGRFSSRAEAYRAHRDPAEGLLMLYPISAAAQPLKNSTTRIPLFTHPDKAATLVAYAVSFPVSGSNATVEYISAPPPEGTL